MCNKTYSRLLQIVHACVCVFVVLYIIVYQKWEIQLLVYLVFNHKICLLIVTSMDDFNKTIPAVCSLTLQCPGARSSVLCDNNNMVIF